MSSNFANERLGYRKHVVRCLLCFVYQVINISCAMKLKAHLLLHHKLQFVFAGVGAKKTSSSAFIVALFGV